MKISFLGGAGEYGRTCVLLDGDNARILLDCGINASSLSNDKIYPLLNKDIAASIDLVLLSHSHKDHSSALPYLYSLGYSGSVICSEQTRKQLPYYFDSWRRVNSNNKRILLYETLDEEKINFDTFTQPVGERYFSDYNVTIKWGSSGHILGSVWYDIIIDGKTVFFSGDYHTESALFTYIQPQILERKAAIIDTAYGLDDKNQVTRLNLLRDYIYSALCQNDNILLPLPKIGRSQEIILFLQGMNLPNQSQIVVEKSLIDPIQKLNSNSNWLKDFSKDSKDNCIEIVENHFQRKKVLSSQAPKIILCPGGMMESKISKLYFENLLKDGNLHVVFTGHVSKNTFGYEVLNNKFKKCEAKYFKFKVHPNIYETKYMIDILKAKHIFLTHNLKEENDIVRDELASNNQQVYSLKSGEGYYI